LSLLPQFTHRYYVFAQLSIN